LACLVMNAAFSLADELKLVPHPLALEDGKAVTLNIPEGWNITLAAQGMKRPRFMAFSPDGRLFIGGLYNLSDTKKGSVYILADFDRASGRFQKSSVYLSGLRNPNSVGFYTDAAGKQWIYIAMTDHLVRYAFHNGDSAPTGPPEILATFPAYGLNYKYGGWHLTRTICFGGNGKLYVSVGSSCDSCVERKEETRACIVEMDPDGKNQRLFASGMRNAVDIKWILGGLMATDMGADKLGDDEPHEAIYQVKDGLDYGWPYTYNSKDGVKRDPKFTDTSADFLAKVPEPFWTYVAHASPLGIEYFDETAPAELKNHFLVAFHGSSKKSLGHGYKVIRMNQGEAGDDFITGFWKDGKVYARPCDILKDNKGGFFLTDDFIGVVYHLSPNS